MATAVNIDRHDSANLTGKQNINLSDIEYQIQTGRSGSRLQILQYGHEERKDSPHLEEI